MKGEPLRKRAEEKAYRLLARRAHSEKELRAKLKGGGFSEAVVHEVIEKCRELGYLNDGNYARQRARDLAVNRLAGDRQDRLRSARTGISEELSRQAIAEARGELSQGQRSIVSSGKYSPERPLPGWMRRKRPNG